MNNPNLENQTLAKYQVLKEIGRGNMGTVYLGHDPFIDRPVAIKVAHEEQLNSPEEIELFRKLFFNEAQTAGMLKHPNITSIFDAGMDKKVHYIVMEYVHSGKTLEDFCTAEHLLPIPDIITIIYKCALALDYAHKKGVVHRDIKPRNILLTENMDIKISDFGIAVLPGELDERLLQHAGSPLYMSPEQVKEEDLTSQSDLFSLGVLFFELMTGKHPFPGSNMAAISHMILHTQPPLLSELRADVPEVAQRVVERCLAKDPNYRYQTGLDLAGDLTLVFDFLEPPSQEVPRQQKFDSLRTMIFFQEFVDTELWELINSSSWYEMAAGREIIIEGEIDKSFYVVIEGSVLVSKGGIHLDVLERGDCFGEMGYVSGKRRSASIRAQDNCTVMKIKAPMIERTSVNCQLRFHKLFLATLIERLSKATDRIAEANGQ